MRFILLVSLYFFASSVSAVPDEILPPVALEKGTVVVLNIPQTRVFLFVDKELTGSWEVGPGAARNPTPTGTWKIGEIRLNPTWYVPTSIQKEMAALKMPVRKEVPPGPDNPLGPVFIRLGQSAIGIHGTNRPNTVADWQSYGCVRMRSEEVMELANWLQKGDTVKVIYEPVVVSEVDDEVYLTVFPDIYEKKLGAYTLAAVQAQLDALRIQLDSVDPAAAEEALRDPSGVPVLIGRKALTTVNER